MPIYKIQEEKIIAVERSTFDREGLLERQDIQRLLKFQIEVIAPDTLVVAEEFGDWEDSRRRIDLLAIDKNANLVVIELKRTEDGGHMELQAIRYASMISTMTFNKLIETYQRFLIENKVDGNAEAKLLEFLDWSEPNEEQFGQEVKIVLASAEFSKELTSSVMWLNDYGIDIQCVRLHPYSNHGETLLDVQTVIPIPEVADYQVRIREKKQKERESRTSNRDFSKFNISVNGNPFKQMNKRWMMYQIIRGIIESGAKPTEIQSVVNNKTEVSKKLFEIFDGELEKEELHELIMAEDSGGKHPRTKRFFCEDGEFFHCDGETYVLTNQWGKYCVDMAQAFKENFPDADIELQAAS